jgi:hypothetical protein
VTEANRVETFPLTLGSDAGAADRLTLLREGLVELRRAFPHMPEFEMQLAQEGSSLLN